MDLPDNAYLDSAMDRLLDLTAVGSGCWPWQGGTGRSGYGQLYFVNRLVGAHRVSWIVYNRKPIPEKGVIAHRCDVRRCVRPDHLFLTDQQGNIDDMFRKSRQAQGPDQARAISEGWTPEKRVRQSEIHRSMWKARREEDAVAAGVPLDWKRCSTCKTWKSRDDYGANARRGDGLSSLCRPCDRVRLRELMRRKRAAAKAG